MEWDAAEKLPGEDTGGLTVLGTGIWKGRLSEPTLVFPKVKLSWSEILTWFKEFIYKTLRT